MGWDEKVGTRQGKAIDSRASTTPKHNRIAETESPFDRPDWKKSIKEWSGILQREVGYTDVVDVDGYRTVGMVGIA